MPTKKSPAISLPPATGLRSILRPPSTDGQRSTSSSTRHLTFTDMSPPLDRSSSHRSLPPSDRLSSSSSSDRRSSRSDDRPSSSSSSSDRGNSQSTAAGKSGRKSRYRDGKEVDGVLYKINAGLWRKKGPWYAFAQWAEKRTGMDRMDLFVLLACFVIVFLSTSSRWAMLLGDIIAFSRPAYVALAAAIEERPGRVQTRAVRSRWFTYWLMFVTELVTMRWPALSRYLHRVPCYGLIRCAFFLWCSAPIEVNGAALIDTKIVRRHVMPLLYAVQRDR